MLIIVDVCEEREEREGTTKAPENGMLNTCEDLGETETVNDRRLERDVIEIVNGKYDLVPKMDVPGSDSTESVIALREDGAREILSGGVEPRGVRIWEMIRSFP